MDGSATLDRALLSPSVSSSEVESWFSEHRSYLRGVAYRMLGSVADAEDVLQDAYLRVSRSEWSHIREPKAYLFRLVTRLCLDVLKSARQRRETYVGPWLPEPVLDSTLLGGAPPIPGERLSLHEDISLALLVSLERLTPAERAAFILRDVFDASYEELSETLGKELPACRKLVSRARQQIRAEKPRFSADQEVSKKLLLAFQQATESGDPSRLEQLLTVDVTYTSDGGGKVSAATKPLIGPHNVARFLIGLSKKFALSSVLRAEPAVVNGSPGMLFFEGEVLTQALALELGEGGKVCAFYAVRNPDKLRHLQSSAG